MVEDLTHLDNKGNAKMVNVSEKEPSHRRAVASAKILMSKAVLEKIENKTEGIKKGDVLAVARVAGITAAKKTSELIPLCHLLELGSVSVDFEFLKTGIEIIAIAETFGKTGVEMEALTACSISALTIYDMCKSLDKSMQITDISLLEKTGGKSGTYKR